MEFHNITFLNIFIYLYKKQKYISPPPKKKQKQPNSIAWCMVFAIISYQCQNLRVLSIKINNWTMQKKSTYDLPISYTLLLIGLFSPLSSLTLSLSFSIKLSNNLDYQYNF